jgi:hypothetical protein
MAAMTSLLFDIRRPGPDARLRNRRHPASWRWASAPTPRSSRRQAPAAIPASAAIDRAGAPQLLFVAGRILFGGFFVMSGIRHF